MTKTQTKIIIEMRNGAVIGELSDKVNGRYELFIKKTNWQPITGHRLEHPFMVKRLNKNTVFVLLSNGLIIESDCVAVDMQPFSRDVWYIIKGAG